MFINCRDSGTRTLLLKTKSLSIIYRPDYYGMVSSLLSPVYHPEFVSLQHAHFMLSEILDSKKQ